MKNWSTQNIPDQTGKVAIVTGGNTGLGYQTVLELANAGAEVVLTARNSQKANAAVKKIKALSPTAKVSFYLLDLSSLEAISNFAQKIADNYNAIDLLINNAGVAAPNKRLSTTDGFELQFGVNFLGHFALTAHLLPLLKNSSAPRVVTLSSIVHKQGKINFDDLMSTKNYSPFYSYSQSKLANLIFAQQLQRRSQENNWGLLSLASHPGMARTELTKSRPGQTVLWFNRVFDFMAPLFSGTAQSGTLPSLFAATSPNVKPSGYYGPTGLGEIKGPVGIAKMAPAALDLHLAQRLWAEAENLVGMKL